MESTKHFIDINFQLGIEPCRLDYRLSTLECVGTHGGIVVKVLRYKPAGRGFDSRWCHWNFSVS